MLREADIVAGKYRIEKVLGAGAMGTVYTAHHILLKEKVAIKFLRPEAIGHAESVSRFVREARAAVQIQSEHVVRVRDVDLEDGRPYIVMEHLEGCDLAAWLRQKGHLPVDQAVDFIVQTCDAIAKAHELGIIHRDLKPANIFVVQRTGEEPTIKVLDFGISKTTGLVADTLALDDERLSGVVTEESVIIGSPFYMSPEQMASARDVDERTDIWALGVTLCQLITGRLPFDGANLIQVFSHATSNMPLRLRETSPHITSGHEAIILKCLQRERDKRYRSVRELVMALAEEGSGRAASLALRLARGDGAALDTPHGSPGGESSRGEGTLPSRITTPPLVASVTEVRLVRKRRVLALAALVVVAGLVAAKAIARLGTAPADRAPSAPTEAADPRILSARESAASSAVAPIATEDPTVAAPAAPARAELRVSPPTLVAPGEGVGSLHARVRSTTASTASGTVTAKAATTATAQPTAVATTEAGATPTPSASPVPNPIPTVLGGRR